MELIKIWISGQDRDHIACFFEDEFLLFWKDDVTIEVKCLVAVHTEICCQEGESADRVVGGVEGCSRNDGDDA